MNLFPFHSSILLIAISIHSVGAIHCDFCPDPATLNSDYSLCTELLRIARGGNLYHSEEECDFNIPILANRCKCSVLAPPRHEPCEPCPSITNSNFDLDSDDSSMTFAKPGGKLILYENKKYSCIEVLFSARNGGLHSSKCDDLLTSNNSSPCGRCVKTEMCKVDETLCRPNTVLVASNPDKFPGPSNLWSTALTCQDLIEGARNGSLLSNKGCNTLEKSILATFNSKYIGHGLFDLSDCGLQCNYDESAASKDTTSLQLPTRDILAGRSEGANSQTSEVRSDGPSLEHSDGPSFRPSDGPSLQPSDGPSLQPSDGPSLQMSEMPSHSHEQSQKPSDLPSDLPSMMELVRSQTNHPLNRFPETDQDTSQESGLEKEIEQQCLICDLENDSAFYLYKDFDQSGVTFFEALSAPDHRSECKDQDSSCEVKESLYPELDNCYLADVMTFDDLIAIQAVIPPQKAAYVAVYKDTVAQYEAAKSCSQSLPDFNCVVENYKENLIYGYGKNNDGEDPIGIGTDSDGNAEAMSCSGLKEGWFNYGSDVAIPSNIWMEGQPSYCNSGAIQNAAAVW
eukprot:CAMPEP_0197178436 /NCGR_PEP_ID=MMETSP1423-20130617/3716_1 /TAXON_ID=476441 /ORGANISM="Pseudo-nitzschia heimii, Strain UNC1101" /LENGTH=567 /DNA_ID=CAMNT_0042628179 /DNA_START=31 /DNA_END=1731 /DNA_ORIENTATION=+